MFYAWDNNELSLFIDRSRIKLLQAVKGQAHSVAHPRTILKLVLQQRTDSSSNRTDSLFCMFLEVHLQVQGSSTLLPKTEFLHEARLYQGIPMRK
jgi:hypothetical protein